METHRSFSPVFIQHFILVLMPPFNFVVLQAQEGKCLVGKNLFLCVATDLDAARNSIDKALETMGEQASPDMFTIPIFPVARRVDGPRMTDSFKAHAARLHTKYQGSKPDNSEAPKPSGNARWNSKRRATVVIYDNTEFPELSPTAKKPAVVSGHSSNSRNSVVHHRRVSQASSSSGCPGSPRSDPTGFCSTAARGF